MSGSREGRDITLHHPDTPYVRLSHQPSPETESGGGSGGGSSRRKRPLPIIVSTKAPQVSSGETDDSTTVEEDTRLGGFWAQAQLVPKFKLRVESVQKICCR